MLRPVATFWQTLKSLLVSEVPADVAACEFDCREVNCVRQDWEPCPQRLQKAEAIADLSNSQ